MKKKVTILNRAEEPVADIVVHVHPNSSVDRFTVIQEGVIHIKLRARPVDGKANAALIDFLSESLDVRKSAISIHRGEKSRDKHITIRGMSRSQVIDKTASLVTEHEG